MSTPVYNTMDRAINDIKKQIDSIDNAELKSSLSDAVWAWEQIKSKAAATAITRAIGE